jgi:hypothetical protein
MIQTLQTKWSRFQFKWKQYWCLHFFSDSVLISKTFHPEIMENEDFVYVKNHRQCKKCEKYWDDNGLELKMSTEEWVAKGKQL